jgi:Ca-activated chloride channel family protein
VQLDEETLKAIAEMTGAKYYHAADEEALKKVYKTLTAQFVAETKRTELTGLVALPALLLLIAAAALSLVWSNRMA